MTVWEVTFPLACSSHHLLVDTAASSCRLKRKQLLYRVTAVAPACTQSQPCKKYTLWMPCCSSLAYQRDALGQLQQEPISVGMPQNMYASSARFSRAKAWLHTRVYPSCYERVEEADSSQALLHMGAINTQIISGEHISYYAHPLKILAGDSLFSLLVPTHPA